MTRGAQVLDPGPSKKEEAAPPPEAPQQGVTTSGVCKVVPAGGGTATAEVLRIYDEIDDDLLDWLRGLKVEEADVEDVANEVYERLLRWAHKNGKPANPPGLAREMAKLAAVDYHRRRRRHRPPPDGAPDETEKPDSGDGPDLQLLRTERLDHVRQALDTLSEAELDLLRKVLHERVPQAKIAKELGENESTINMRYLRALEKLEREVRRRCKNDERR